MVKNYYRDGQMYEVEDDDKFDVSVDGTVKRKPPKTTNFRPTEVR